MNTSQPERCDQQPDLTPSLVLRLRAGENDAGIMLNELYREAMLRFCLGYLGDPEQAEDAVQTIFYKVLHTPAVPERFRPWIYRIARNHCLNMRRDRARRKSGVDLPNESQLHLSAIGALSRLVKHEQQAHVAHLLAALPAEFREALHLRYGENLNRSEIAEILDIPESVVKSRLYEGLKKLREHSSMLE
ncbi:MAG: sigma-70 family RNA polymerase sigma factor [Planctomycetota bacterium]